MAQRASAITARITSVADRLRPQRRGQVDADALVAEVLRHYPDGDAELVVAVDPQELDVRALGKARVVLDQRSESQQIGAVGLPPDHRVRIADRDRRELDLLA